MHNPTTISLDARIEPRLQTNVSQRKVNTSNQYLAYPEFKYRDTTTGGWDYRNNVKDGFITNPKMEDAGETVFRFPRSYLEQCVQTQSVTGYNGECYADFLPLDIDSKNLDFALKQLKDFLQYLEVEYEISPADLPVWFSGSKGFHIAIPTLMFGSVEPSVELPTYFKALVETSWGDWEFDMKIYDMNRLLRCENTINSKSNLYKIRIPNVLNMDLETIMKMAKEPGVVSDPEELYDVRVSERLANEFKAVQTNTSSSVDPGQISRKPDWESLIKTSVSRGSRNNTAFDIARGMKMDGLTKEAVVDNLNGWNTSLPEPMDNKEVESIIKSVFSKQRIDISPIESTINYKHSDYGNAELFVELHQNITRFDHTRKKWYLWNGQYYKMDETEQIYHIAKDTARKRQEIAMSVSFDEERKKDLKWAIGIENMSRFRNMLSIAEAFTPIAVTADAWESGDYLIQFENGVYDLERAKFRDGQSQDMNYQSTGFAYDPDANCPIWENAILEMMNGDTEMVNFLQHALGYSLTGLTTEQCLFILTGGGSNGKSVVLDTLLSLLGGYGSNSPFSTFEAKNNETSNDIARLFGTRLVSSSESSQSRRLDEERIKAITGSDKITARFLYQEFFTYTPKFKIWFAVNTLPEIRGTDNGIWRRIKVVPFDVSFQGREDRSLTQKLHHELPGIMNWAIQGAHQWMSHGLPIPSRVKDATDIYRSNSDIVAAFLDEKVSKDLVLKIKASVLYKVFREYCIQSGQQRWTPKTGQ